MKIEKNYQDIYDINKKKIGSGSFGNVFKAKYKDKEEYVAIKIIDKDNIKEGLRQLYLNDDIEKEYLKIEQCLIKEVQYMKKCSINNNNSIKVYDIYNTEEEFVIVMELCDENLMNLLVKKGKDGGFYLSEIYNILMQLNNTFKIMSEDKIAHRDLKPQNILIKYNNEEKKDYTVKITDYGISKTYENNANFETFAGTLEYIAPEILKGEKYNYKCDLWSLGIIIYLLYFRENPLRGCTQQSILSKCSFGKKLFKKSGNSIFDDLIRGLLENNPKKRFTWKQYLNHSFFRNKPIKEYLYIKIQNDEKEKLLSEKKVKKSGEIDAEKINVGKYENSYNEGSFWDKVKNAGKKLGIKPLYVALLLYYSMAKASLLDKALIVGSLGYFISPLDLIPDYIPIIGLTDDAAVLMFTYYRIFRIIDDEIRDNAKKTLESVFGTDYDKKIIEGL